jgi:hypothetical protein
LDLFMECYHPGSVLPMPMKCVGGLRNEKSGFNSRAYPYKYFATIWRHGESKAHPYVEVNRRVERGD